MFKFLLKHLLQPQLGPLHELRAEPEHQNTELQLAQRAIAVEITLPEHRPKVLIAESLQAQQSSVPLEALKGYHPSVGVLEQVEAVAELVDEAVPTELVRHHGEVVVEMLGLLRVFGWLHCCC